MLRDLVSWPSLIQQEQGHGSRFVFGVELEDGIEATALLFEGVCFGCQPEPGLDHQGARTGGCSEQRGKGPATAATARPYGGVGTGPAPGPRASLCAGST